MKVIITGGEGFIGKALATSLSRRGAEVIIVDRKIGMEVIPYFKTHSLQGIDCVFHLAAQTSVFNDNHRQILYDNVESFMVVCDCCRDAHVKLVYASSSTANGLNTTSLYGISKRFDEEYARCYNPTATGVRLHNVYGPDPRQGTLLWHLMNDKRVRLVNGGRNIRHFTYIDDAVEGLIYAVGCNATLVNVANPEIKTVLDFALEVKRYNNADIEAVAEMRQFDKTYQCIDRSTYVVPLPYTPVDDGIRKVFEYANL